ncbi:hypothetical protein AB0F30_29270 [Streptomyces sp. NPDC029006]|uniref:hypothetical protein n=1 Tax=Streptomyces sp. NPDC029006 TaxID=3155467 RepID=UPI003407C502
MSVRTRMSPVVLIMAGVLLVTGCGGSEGDSKDDVASVDKKGTSAPPVDKNATYRAYASCLRAQGVTGVTVTDQGIGIPGGGTTDSANQPDAPGSVEGAMKTCDKKVPGMQQVRAQRNQKIVEDARKLAACARKNGMPDMPDPTIVNGAPHMTMPEVRSEVWGKVLKTCKKYVAGAVAITGAEQ